MSFRAISRRHYLHPPAIFILETDLIIGVAIGVVHAARAIFTSNRYHMVLLPTRNLFLISHDIDLRLFELIIPAVGSNRAG